jgi:AcrR family transcriptional regulator
MRKQPRQARSRATVDAIVEAGARVLNRRGWAQFTTNETAEAAGVSIGSLYQYFPNKLALVEAIRRRHFGDVLTAIRAAADSGSLSLRRQIERLVQGMIEAHGAHATLHRALLEEAPRGDPAHHESFEAEYLRLYAALIAASRGQRARQKIAAQILSAAVSGVIHDAARRGTLRQSGLKDGLVDLICAYLGERGGAKPSIKSRKT